MGVERKQPSTAARRAIWEAWSKKSAYTGEPLTWAQLHVDHIIPIAKPELLEALQLKGLLAADFDLNGFDNLLPAANHQNQGKAASEMGESALIWFIEQARQKRPDIERRLAASLRSNEQIKSYLAVKAASEKNNVSLDEMIGVYAHQFEGEVALRITPEIEGAQIATANSAAAAALMDKPFALGSGTISEVHLRSSNGGSVICRTSNEFIQAEELGYFAMTQTEIKIASMANETTEALRAIRDSSFAEESALREPIVKLKDLERWSAEWVTEGLFNKEDVKRVSGLATISDLVKAGVCEIESLKDHEIRFIVYDGLDIMMRESMRADLDGDRWEEILVFHYLSAARAGGSFGNGQAMMAKVGEDGLLHMKAYPPEKGQ